MEAILKLFTCSIFLLTFAGLCHGEENLLCTRHEVLTPVHNFNMSKILGKWILFKSYSALGEDAISPGYTCLEYTYSETFYPLMPYIFIEKFLNETGDVVDRQYGIIPSANPAIWTKLYELEPDYVAEDAVFLHTDYENWALQFACKVRDGHMHETMIMWTRTRNPDPETISFLHVLVENYGFSLENEIPSDQTNCPFLIL